VLVLTTLLGPLAVLSSWEAIENRVKEYYVFMLMLQAGMLGVFISLDFFLFYVFWEVMLVPMYFLIGVWGGPRKLYAAIKFFLYTLFGSVLLLLGILALYFTYPVVAAQQDAAPGLAILRATTDISSSIRRAAAESSAPSAFHSSQHPATASAQKVYSPLDADLAVGGILSWVCHPGADVPLPYLAARRSWRPQPQDRSFLRRARKFGTYGFLRFNLPVLPGARTAVCSALSYRWLS
jgi:hypothetical protein